MKACMTVSDDQRLLDFEDRMSAGQLQPMINSKGLEPGSPNGLTIKAVRPVTGKKGTEMRSPCCGPPGGAGMSSPRRRYARLDAIVISPPTLNETEYMISWNSHCGRWLKIGAA